MFVLISDTKVMDSVGLLEFKWFPLINDSIQNWDRKSSEAEFKSKAVILKLVTERERWRFTLD